MKKNKISAINGLSVFSILSLRSLWQRRMDAFNSEFVIPAIASLRSFKRSGKAGDSFHHPIKTIKKIINHFAQDSLYRNSIYLMLSTAIMAFFGFFFWIINTRLFSPTQIGLATALISSRRSAGRISYRGTHRSAFIWYWRLAFVIDWHALFRHWFGHPRSRRVYSRISRSRKLFL